MTLILVTWIVPILILTMHPWAYEEIFGDVHPVIVMASWTMFIWGAYLIWDVARTWP